MTRYFFDVNNTKFSTVDDVGREFATKDEVSAEALRVLCSIATDDPQQHLHGRLETIVRDTGGRIVLTATVSLSSTWVGGA